LTRNVITPAAIERAVARKKLRDAQRVMREQIDILDGKGLDTATIASKVLMPQSEVHNYLFSRGWR